MYNSTCRAVRRTRSRAPARARETDGREGGGEEGGGGEVTGAGRADERGGLAGLDDEGDPVENLRRSPAV